MQKKKGRSHAAFICVTWYQLMLFLVQEPHTSLPYGQANKLNQLVVFGHLHFFPKEKNLFTNSHYNFFLIFFFCCHNVKFCPHKNTGMGCLATSLLCGGPSNYTTKIPLALQCTIIPLGFVNQDLQPFSFGAIHFYQFAFIGVSMLPWIRHVPTLHDCCF